MKYSTFKIMLEKHVDYQDQERWRRNLEWFYNELSLVDGATIDATDVINVIYDLSRRCRVDTDEAIKDVRARFFICYHALLYVTDPAWKDS